MSTCTECKGSPVVGIEYRGIYDGVLIWGCHNGHHWPRFPEGTRQYDKAVELIANWARKESDG